MSGAQSYPLLLMARSSSSAQQVTCLTRQSLFLRAKLRLPRSTCEPPLSCTPKRSLWVPTSATNSKVVTHPTDRKLVPQYRPRCGPTGFLASLRSCSRAIAIQTRAFTSEKPRNNEDSDQTNTDAPSGSRKKPRLLDRLPLPVHENIYTLPNILTFSRLAVAPLIGYFIVNQNPVLALSLFVYASATDLVDGWIARKFNQQTVVGTVIDPMADKTLMTVGVVCLAMNSSIPVWLAGLILSRDVGLAIAAIYYRWISLPPPKTMARYWDFSLPSAEVKPTGISKVNTALQLLLLGSAMTMPVLPEAMVNAWSLHEAMTGLQYIVGLTTVWSGMSYVYSKDAVKILHREFPSKGNAKTSNSAKRGDEEGKD